MNTIILVEDEQPVRDLLFEFLQDLGYQVHAFETADQAWLHIQQRPYPARLLITDLCMPGKMDGMDLVRKLQATQPESPIVVMSGYHPRADSLRSDDVHWLAKPFSLQCLETFCRKIFSSDRQV
ncbi:response regulator [Pseudomonas sp. CFBP 8771]|uniref:response regulator n=1 Tax=Pseudomonas sp. CFBP 8771 TaxID=2775285 RepID=UPI00177CA117|nr:response regulator [Pseudomonas sp. CFBP 8771]MBD8601526.1 response regulator [Pseudomonas sp. CFBP 8771]